MVSAWGPLEPNRPRLPVAAAWVPRHMQLSAYFLFLSPFKCHTGLPPLGLLDSLPIPLSGRVEHEHSVSVTPGLGVVSFLGFCSRVWEETRMKSDRFWELLPNMQTCNLVAGA